MPSLSIHQMPLSRQKSSGGLLRGLSMNFGAKGAPADLGTSLLLATMRTDSGTITRSIETNELTANDVIVLLMGPPGSGKTTFIESAGDIRGIARHTTPDFSAFRVSSSKFPNSNIVLVDTPAFNDTDKLDLEVLTILSDWLNETYKSGIQLSGLIYFHRISEPRMEGTSLRNWRAFEKISGESFSNKVVLATTMWDDVDEDLGYNRERELEEFWRSNIGRGSTMKRFLCDRPSAADVLSPILEDVTKRPLRLQREITDLNMTLKQTTVARALFLQLQALRRECEESLVTVRDDLQNPSLNRQELTNLEEKYKNSSFLLERVTIGLTGLKAAPTERLQRFFLMTGLSPAFGRLGLGKKPDLEEAMPMPVDARGDEESSSSFQNEIHRRSIVRRPGDKKLRRRPR